METECPANNNHNNNTWVPDVALVTRMISKLAPVIDPKWFLKRPSTNNGQNPFVRMFERADALLNYYVKIPQFDQQVAHQLRAILHKK